MNNSTKMSNFASRKLIKIKKKDYFHNSNESDYSTMKKLIILVNLLIASLVVNAIPAKPGQWKTLKLTDGSEVVAQLVGDEHAHYYQDSQGATYVWVEDDLYEQADVNQINQQAMARRAKVNQKRQLRAKRNAIGDFTTLTGKKKGLIILANFKDKSLASGHDAALYNRICNEEGYTSSAGFKGSVYDYFKAQSYGKFELTFDVVGPITLPQNMAYYGTDSNRNDPGSDQHPGQMIASACQMVDSEVNFADYDWDGDGYVDQVFVLYAGLGQANGGATNTIWPHEWELSESDYGRTLYLDGVTIDTYATSSEMNPDGIDGIGTICHEFSHCLGLPDMYDVNYGGNFGMGSWSLMDNGSYNGDGFVPSGLTSFEKLTCGWVTPKELKKNTTVTDLKPLSTNDDVYIVYNDNYTNEYFLIENRQKVGWDAQLPGNGMLILYVDFDKTIWENNLVNTNVSSYYSYYGYPTNDHQRCTIFHANNKTSGTGSSGDCYPYGSNNSLTNTSTPSAKLYHPNTDGKKLMSKPITEIKRNGDGTMSFKFTNDLDPDQETPENPDDPDKPDTPTDAVFYETFDKCAGTGGNDGKWSGNIASSTFAADNSGWENDKASLYGANKCARFGSTNNVGIAVSPEIDVDGSYSLSFQAAPWGSDGTVLTLSASGNATVSPSQFTLTKEQWTSCEAKVDGSGTIRLTFTPIKRLFLDEVKLVKNEADDIVTIMQNHSQDAITQGVYSLDGRFVGTTTTGLPHGIYVCGGRKIIK